MQHYAFNRGQAHISVDVIEQIENLSTLSRYCLELLPVVAGSIRHFIVACANVPPGILNSDLYTAQWARL